MSDERKDPRPVKSDIDAIKTIERLHQGTIERNGLHRTGLNPLYLMDTRLDTVVGIVAVAFAVLATLGWLVPQIRSWSGY